MEAKQLAMTTEPQPLAEVKDLSGGLLEVIARAARDPNVDIDKMERLLEMQERVHARNAKAAYYQALAEMQPELPVIEEHGGIKDRNGNIQSTYALWEDVNEGIRPILQKHGFALSFKVRRTEGDIITTGILSHRDGHSEETELSLPTDTSGSKNAVQAVGSSSQYGKRYTAYALLNITTKGLDDDGTTATNKKATGEPMPRAKLDGPHTSKTALRTALHAIIASVRQAQSQEEVSAIVREAKNKATIDQAKRDWPALIDGDPEIAEDTGLRGALAQRKTELAESGQLQEAIRSMKECETKPALANWLEANEAYIEGLDGAESRTFQLAYDLHESGITAMDQVSA